MIAGIYAHNFKGATFTATLRGLTLVVGPNGAGKSARSQALQLAVLGYVPGIGKRNGDIMDAFLSEGGKDLRAGITLESGHKLERRFSRSRTGTVSMEMYSGGIKCKPDESARALADVAVVDLSVFLGLSDARKVDELFRLFPPSGNVCDLAAKIEAQAKRIAALEREERDAASMVSNLTVRRSRIELPAGSMADKQNEIDKAEADLRQARADLEAERIAAAREEEQAAAEARRIEAARVEEQTRARQAQQPAPATAPMPSQGGTQHRPAPGYAGQPLRQEPASPPPTAPDVTAILERIQSAMDRAGCDVCAARMVIKRELAEARQGQPMEAVA